MQDFASLKSPAPGQPHYTLAKTTHSNSSWLTCSQLLASISSARRRCPRKNASYPSCQREGPDGALETFSSRDCLASPPAQPQNGSLALLASPALWVLCWEPCALDCDSQVSVPDLQLSTHPELRKVRFATTCSKARDPAAVLRYIQSGLSIVEIPEGMAAGRALWEGEDWTRLSQGEHCHNWIWPGKESLRKKSKDPDATFSTSYTVLW